MSTDRSTPVDLDADPTVVAQYPSVDFPPTPAFRLSVPVGWREVPATRAEMLVVAPTRNDGYQTNVMVVVGRVPVTATPSEYLAESIRHEFDQPGRDLIENVADPQDPTPAHATVARFTLRDSTYVECHQLHVYVPSSPRSAHVVTVTGTIAASAPVSEREAVQRIVRSFQLPLGRLPVGPLPADGRRRRVRR